MPVIKYRPKYIDAFDSGILSDRIALADNILGRCTLCPRQCNIDRTEDEKGICNTGKEAVVSSFFPHFGEEPCLSGDKGSGTLFFTNCSLLCCFCQNFDISHNGEGQTLESFRIAALMMDLQARGCHNINLVTPGHVVPQILKALDVAVRQGLNIPIVYNSSGYDSIETLELLDGIIDIYMPDFKFWNPDHAQKACNAPDYPQTARTALQEMHRQVGDLKMDENGIAVSGLLVRHLVMPDLFAGTPDVLNFLKTTISPSTHVNIMSQYHPAGNADQIPSLLRVISVKEFKDSLDMAKDLGLKIVS